jgi:membrane protease YdiL (CAAX protease family)
MFNVSPRTSVAFDKRIAPHRTPSPARSQRWHDAFAGLIYTPVFRYKYNNTMSIQTARAGLDAPSSVQLALVFTVLFLAYQLPEGLGLRLLHNDTVNAVLMLMFLPVAWLCARALGFRGLDAWYMGLTPGWGAQLAAAFGLAFVAKAAALGLGACAGVYRLAPAGASIGALGLAALAMLPFTFFPSVAEDIVTRGFLMRACPALARRWLFVLASSALYVLNHIYRLANGPAEWLMLFSYGLAYAAALYYSRSLWPAIGLHWGWNYAGQIADRVANVDLARPAFGPVVSTMAHLGMLAVVVLAAKLIARRPS